MGVVLQESAEVVTLLLEPEQVYVTLWSHMHAVPGHIHLVVQSVTAALLEEHGGGHGVRLQVERFDRKVFPDPVAAAEFAGRARETWSLPGCSP